MSSIYKITNLITGKMYVGKTDYSLKARWDAHIRDSRKNRTLNRPLYSAIRKYGEENFSIELLETCNEEDAPEREIYHIIQLGTYSDGYNATLGGEGSSKFSNLAQEIVNSYLKTKNASSTAREFGCCVDTVKFILEENNVEKFHRSEYYHPNGIINVTKGLIFNSVSEATQYLIDNGLSLSKDKEMVRRGIGRAISGIRKTYLNDIWQRQAFGLVASVKDSDWPSDETGELPEVGRPNEQTHYPPRFHV